MLRFLEIRDFLIIDHLELEFQPGLNVFTGETGAGKSILLDALGFVLGWQSRNEAPQKGKTRGEVTAVFEMGVDSKVQGILANLDLPVQSEITLHRKHALDGRKTAWINDRRVSAETLRSLSDILVEIHGRKDERGLLNPSGHLSLLDRFGNYGFQIKAVQEAWIDLRNAQKEYEQLESETTKVQTEENYWRHVMNELDTLAPESGEDQKLDSLRRMMQQSEKIRTDILKAKELLCTEGAEGAIVNAIKWLENVADSMQDELDEASAALSRALVELGEAQSGIDKLLSKLSFNPEELEAIEERLFAIRALCRKHSIAPDELSHFGSEVRARLELIDAGSVNLEKVLHRVHEAKRVYQESSEELREARLAAAQELDQSVMAELIPLKMEHAKFLTKIEENQSSATGVDDVTFTVTTNPGVPPGPLNEIVSAGELSRFLLAMKVCLAEPSQEFTMIFDEIDRGIGGATADAVGQRLFDISRSSQVIVVTHSPQVAAKGDNHWQVQKKIRKGLTISTTTLLDNRARIEEIARMLAGSSITKAARQAARALLES
ncbi:MAG: DNA repair protein RecN [Aestuariivita sp.]|nr:DNA repair protein RecN [Aestuariivita sp.]